MSNIVGIRFERAGKISYFSCGDLQLTFGDHVIVESSWGLDFGTVVTPTLPEPQPQAEAAALYSRALTSQETAWVILRAISWGTISGGVWPRIKMGA